MKAIVLGVRGGRAALLLEDGTTTYRFMRCKPGERVEIPEQTNIIGQIPKTAKVAAAAILAITVIGGGYYETMIPVSYVTMDVNMSTEYSLNRLNVVMETKTLSDTAPESQDQVPVTGKTITDAVRSTVDELENEGDINDDSYILLSVNSDNKNRQKKLENELSQTMEALTKNGGSYSILKVSDDERETAMELSISSGRYKKMLEDSGDSEYDDEMVSEYKTKPVEELMNTDKKANNIADNDKTSENANNTLDTTTEKAVNIKSTNTNTAETPAENKKDGSAENPSASESEPQNNKTKENKEDAPKDGASENNSQPSKNKTPASDQPSRNNPAQAGGQAPQNNPAQTGGQTPQNNPAPAAGQTPQNNPAPAAGQAPQNDPAPAGGQPQENYPAPDLEKPLDNNTGGSDSTEDYSAPDNTEPADRDSAPNRNPDPSENMTKDSQKDRPEDMQKERQPGADPFNGDQGGPPTGEHMKIEPGGFMR